MKINLLINTNAVLSGYTNVESSLDNLDDVVEDGEAVEIRAIDILDYFPYEQSNKIINHWISKLAHGGKLIIEIVDLVEIAKGVARYELDMDSANLFLHGDVLPRLATFSISQVSNYLVEKGLKILKKRTDKYRSVIEAERA